MKTVISVKVDQDVKASAQEVAHSAGLTLSAIVNAYLRQLAATRRIEFYAPEPMTPKLERLITKAEQDIEAGDTVGPFDSAADFLRALKKKPAHGR